MANRLCPLALAAVSTAALPAGANPYTTEKAMARQIPHTTHVQVTVAQESGADRSLPLRRDGVALRPNWSQLDAYTLNAGSGLVTYEAVQYCDCNVPVGAHTYSTTFTFTYPDGHSEQFDAEASPITVLAELDDPADAGPVPADAMPWEIPDPVEVQGLDCVETCAHPEVAGDASNAVSPQQGGCSLGGRPGGAGAVLAALGGLAVLLAGRRRRQVTTS